MNDAVLRQLVAARKRTGAEAKGKRMVNAGDVEGRPAPLIMRLRRRKRRGSHRKTKGGEFETYREVEEKTEPAKAWNPQSSTEDPDIVQETSSESSEA